MYKVKALRWNRHRVLGLRSVIRVDFPFGPDNLAVYQIKEKDNMYQLRIEYDTEGGGNSYLKEFSTIKEAKQFANEFNSKYVNVVLDSLMKLVKQ